MCVSEVEIVRMDVLASAAFLSTKLTPMSFRMGSYNSLLDLSSFQRPTHCGARRSQPAGGIGGGICGPTAGAKLSTAIFSVRRASAELPQALELDLCPRTKQRTVFMSTRAQQANSLPAQNHANTATKMKPAVAIWPMNDLVLCCVTGSPADVPNTRRCRRRPVLSPERVNNGNCNRWSSGFAPNNCNGQSATAELLELRLPASRNKTVAQVCSLGKVMVKTSRHRKLRGLFSSGARSNN
mmetsp:Transcript_50854/g.146769  ORF Transcript_50854/g.146769 Transcript_50854/m.146769 type:complete len:240 (-) Transcript_50854:571-1290(-)